MLDSPDAEELLAQKRRLREEVNARRNALLPHVRTAKSHSIIERLKSLAVYDKARYPLVYIALPSEVQTLPLVDDRLAHGLSVAVPRVQGDDLGLYEIDAVAELVPGVWGIPEPEPTTSRAANVDAIDVAVIPGVVFDPEGHRLGYGKAYYDKMLQKLGHHVVKIGLAFEVQLVRDVPAEPHDVRMDFVVTEERTIDCSAFRAAELQ